MLRDRKPVGALAFAVAGIVTLAACGTSSSSGGGGDAGGGHSKVDLQQLPDTAIDTRVGRQGGTFRLSTAEPAAIDPYNASEEEGLLVTKNLFDTLTTVGPSGKVEKQLAQSYTSDANCSNWTFNVKPNQKFSDGEPLDAAAIKRGMTRAALGTAGSDVSYHMAGIKGYDELQSSTASDPTKVDFSGVQANGLILKIALSKPDCDFDMKTAQSVFSPVPPAAGSAENKAYNDQPIGNGPFKMEGPWKHDQSITLVRNENYTDGTKPLLDKVQITINDGKTSGFEDTGFSHGDFDYARVVASDLQPFADRYYSSELTKNQFIKKDSYGVTYLQVQVQKKPMDSVKAREAVSYAIDRDAIIKGVLHDAYRKATSLVPPAFASQGTYQPNICKSCVKADPKLAKKLATEAGLGAGTEVSLKYPSGFGHEAEMEAVKGQIETTLGWKVNLKGEPPKILQQDYADPKSTGLFWASWAADYPTAWNFLGPLLGTMPSNDPGNNGGRYSNKEFDRLLAAGQADPNPTSRAEDFKKAEQIAIGQDLALIPLYSTTEYRVFSTQFVGVNLDFFTNPTLRSIGLK
jgi:oligopeptide transport system substrate-binding protein